MENSETVFFGLTNFRNQKTKFGIKIDDRRRHFYCIGKTGMGKSNLMENMAIQDIQAGRGIAYVDPHGEGAEKLLDFIPASRINDVIFFNPADLDYPIAFNVMEKVDFRYRHLVAGGLMGVFKKVWPDVWSARMEYILNNAILALLEYPDATLLGVNRMLADPEYREKVVLKITDPIVKAFWTVEFAKYSQRYEQEATAAIQNKVGQFISNPLIRNLIGQVKSTIDMRDIMDTKKIFIMDLSKGRIGEDNSRLLGALLITKLQLAAMSRVDIPEEERNDFYLYVDEFQNFATESFANILSEARKYRLNIILGHQYIAQLGTGQEAKVRDAVFGNVGTIVVFRVGAEDAEFLEREFTPTFVAEDLVNLPKYNIYLKLMIDGVAGHPFSAETLPPPLPLEESNKEKIIRASRERYGIKREIVEEKISRWAGFGNDEQSSVSGYPIVPVKPGLRQNVASRQTQKINPKIYPKNNFVPDATNQGVSSLPGETKLYDAICSNCGKSTKVIFPPEPGRAVYCKSCLKKMKAEKNNQADKIQINNQNQENNITEGVDNKNVKMFDSSSEVLLNNYKNQNDSSKEDWQDKEVEIENVSFNHQKKSDHNILNADKNRNFEERNITTRHESHHRKEINLSDLKRVLEESLSKKSDKEEKYNDKNIKKKNDSEESPINMKESENKVDVLEDVPEDVSISAAKPKPEEIKALPAGKKQIALKSSEDAKTNKKRAIKPGETIKL